jgi:hypothetical protein
LTGAPRAGTTPSSARHQAGRSHPPPHATAGPRLPPRTPVPAGHQAAAAINPPPARAITSTTGPTAACPAP